MRFLIAIISFLTEIISKLASSRWRVRRRNCGMISVGDEADMTALATAFGRAGRSGVRASASFNRLSEAMGRISPVANAAGLSMGEAAAALANVARLDSDHLESMDRALELARPLNISMEAVTGTSMTVTTGTTGTETPPEFKTKPKKVRSLIRKIRFNGGKHDTTKSYAEFAKGTEARTRVLSRRNANKVRKHCV